MNFLPLPLGCLHKDNFHFFHPGFRGQRGVCVCVCVFGWLHICWNVWQRVTVLERKNMWRKRRRCNLITTDGVLVTTSIIGINDAGDLFLMALAMVWSRVNSVETSNYSSREEVVMYCSMTSIRFTVLGNFCNHNSLGSTFASINIVKMRPHMNWRRQYSPASSAFHEWCCTL